MIIFQHQEVTLSKQIDDFPPCRDRTTQDETRILLNRTNLKEVLCLKLESLTNEINDIAPDPQINKYPWIDTITNVHRPI